MRPRIAPFGSPRCVGLTIGEGGLVDLLCVAAAPFEDAVPLFEARPLEGTIIAFDETRARVGRPDRWSWVLHHGESAVFLAGAHRSKAVVTAFLDDRRPDFWISKRLGVQAGAAWKERIRSTWRT